LKGKVASLISLNPLTQFVELFRMPIYQGTFPEIAVVLKAALLSVLSLAIGLWFFSKHEHRVAFRL
jgi:ABC-type polysaccharide/polyol phosphate export permease